MRRVIALLALSVSLIVSGTVTASPKRHIETPYEMAHRIVYAVFPASTAAGALRVVGCETGHSYNPAEKGGPPYFAYGYFQFIIQNNNRHISYNGRGLTINWYKMNNPWYATEAAYILSQGGTNWHEWVCQP